MWNNITRKKNLDIVPNLERFSIFWLVLTANLWKARLEKSIQTIRLSPNTCLMHRFMKTKWFIQLKTLVCVIESTALFKRRIVREKILQKFQRSYNVTGFVLHCSWILKEAPSFTLASIERTIQEREGSRWPEKKHGYIQQTTNSQHFRQMWNTTILLQKQPNTNP